MKVIKANKDEYYINDNPIKNNYDLICAISGANVEVKDAIGSMFYGYGAKGRSKELYKVVDAVFDNLMDLITDYMDINLKQTITEQTKKER